MYSHRIKNNICIVKAQGSLALNSPYQLKSYVLPLLEDPGVEGLIIHCGGLGSIDSYGIGVIVSLLKTAQEKGKQFGLTQLRKEHNRLFSITRLDKIIEITETEEQAMAKMRG